MTAENANAISMFAETIQTHPHTLVGVPLMRNFALKSVYL